MVGSFRSAALLLRLGGFALGGWGISLVLLQALLGTRIGQAQVAQMGPQVALNLRLAELALERFPPAAVSVLSGLQLGVGEPPAPDPANGFLGLGHDGRLEVQAKQLRYELCRRLPRCPQVVPTPGEARGVWIELASPLEPVWLYAGIRPQLGWPPDPLLVSLSLVSGSVVAAALFLLLEVQRPLQQLEKALGGVGRVSEPNPLPQRGAPEVRRLTRHFNAMLERLSISEQERATMLAGIAHDIKTPLTRLRLRLSLGGLGAEAREKAEADLDDLERITGQFLLFAGGGGTELAVEVPLQDFLAELAARYDGQPVELELTPLTASIQPIALGRAVANLIDNALSYGQPPVLLRLLPWQDDGFELQIWDRGEGIAEGQRSEALMPFQRLDSARGGHGHCGLGLAIAQRVARAHGGDLRLGSPQPATQSSGFCVSLTGHSIEMRPEARQQGVSKSVSIEPSIGPNPTKGGTTKSSRVE
ncbi:histidine kinase [Synechococcus sp. CS-1325]|uniref:ATP-binding protein n=1 Tax=unclassified Synechococcus TaxID=2626047 RepID=UPI000DB2A94E|nr:MULTISPECIES: ATP-binding protein [unclassified Synechococcus]MCT0198717.1 histidine kinase [Synechococcus sp. CS-1325]MCT0231522.1 histidine kinase [Synechococcus sp. CS-1324]PZV02086.1 MAG: histidine kinase [Cyanobium sp.]PZV05524.1 MAG: histidine kinase [Cyanobium sp.]